MNKLVPVLALTVFACGGAASSQLDPSASAKLRAQPESMLHDLDAGNFSGILARLDDDAIVLDLDESNKPVRFQGRASYTEYFRSLEQGAKAQGLKFRTNIVKNDCQATSAYGFCVVEFDQTITAGGNAMGPFHFRATVVARKVGDDWRWTHWHGSLRDLPTSTTTTTSATK